MKRRDLLLAFMAAPVTVGASVITKSTDIIDEETIISVDYDLTQMKIVNSRNDYQSSKIYQYAIDIKNEVVKQATDKGLLIGDAIQSKSNKVYLDICNLLNSQIIESDNGFAKYKEEYKGYYDTSQCKGTISIKLTKALKATNFELI